MRQRQNRQQAEALSERYQPAYVDAFISQRQYPEQTIEEWTSTEGSLNFGASQIYKPLNISVSISGPSDNSFSVDCSKVDWHPRLLNAVKGALTEARRMGSADTLTLSDVTGTLISSDMSASALQSVGVVYPVINGKRVIRSPMIGHEVQVPTPLSHQSNKESILVNWAQKVASKAVSVIAASANGAADASAVDQRLFGQTTLQSLSQMIQKEIAPVSDLFVDPGTSAEQAAQAISDKIMEAVEKAYQNRASDVVAFFKHQQATLSPLIQNPLQQQQQREKQQQRSIFSPSVKAEKERSATQLVQGAISNKIDILYPTQLSLHKDILSPLATSDENLHAAIGHCLCAPSANKRRGKVITGGGMLRRRPSDKSSSSSSSTTTTDVTVSAIPSSSSSSSVTPGPARIDHLASFRAMLGDEQYIAAIAAKNALANVPPSPGFVEIESQHRRDGGGGGRREKAARLMGRRDYDMSARIPLTDRVDAEVSQQLQQQPLTQQARQMPGLEASQQPLTRQARQMPGLEATFVASPTSRKMPGLESEIASAAAVSVTRVGRQMPGLESASTVQRQMPSLEKATVPIASVVPTSSGTATRQMPGLESPATVGQMIQQQQQRIKHGAKQLPQINN